MIETVSGARVHNNVYMHRLESEAALELCSTVFLNKLRVSDSYVISVKTTVYQTALIL